MTAAIKLPKTMRTIGILVFDDVEELGFVGPLEVFGTAARFGGDCRTIVIAEVRSPVRCRNGLVVVPERTIDDVGALDLLLVPGGLDARTHARENARLLRSSVSLRASSPRSAPER